MKIIFGGPRFFAQADEDRFFGWLSALPEYQSVRGVGTDLEVTLAVSSQPGDGAANARPISPLVHRPSPTSAVAVS